MLIKNPLFSNAPPKNMFKISEHVSTLETEINSNISLSFFISVQLHLPFSDWVQCVIFYKRITKGNCHQIHLFVFKLFLLYFISLEMPCVDEVTDTCYTRSKVRYGRWCTCCKYAMIRNTQFPHPVDLLYWYEYSIIKTSIAIEPHVVLG